MLKKWLVISSFVLSSFALQAKDISNDVVVITGGTKGIGLDAATHFVEQGCTVFATGRSVSENLSQEHPKIHFVHMDVSDSDSIQSGLDSILSVVDHIDILINNAGYGVLGAEEAVSIKEAKDLFDVNFFGLLDITQRVLPLMRAKRKGHVINISSSSGIRALPGMGLYAATKYAVEGYSEALAMTVSPWNIKVSIVEPSAVNNKWATNCVVANNLDEVPEYKKLKEVLSKRVVTISKTMGQPSDEIAKLLVEIAKSENPNIRYQTSNRVHEMLSHIHNDLDGRKNFSNGVKLFESLIQ